ncbi:MAG: glutamate 2,3-aminomutase [Clostridia bacterium]|jgi:lysine 2,3-aminomutase|nr:glutamate 2,3-aminomutase [Clostridia bacterium]MDH7573720.1 glutamate 2,3-aminomutase [Clostridia bacterium]
MLSGTESEWAVTWVKTEEGAEQVKRGAAQSRAAELRQRIAEYLSRAPQIPTGFSCREEIAANRERILRILGGTAADWQDWRWHLRHRIGDVDTLRVILDLKPEQVRQIRRVGSRFRWAVSPYYASLMRVGDAGCPIRRQAVPDLREMAEGGEDDPMAEEWTSPVPGVTRRYPDRLIINVTNRCATYCRHCQRRRNIGEVDRHRSRADLMRALEYIRANPEIRDVLLTGGDALLLADAELEWLLRELDGIPHVEIKRLGTRVPVTLPQRVTPALCAILERHPPIYLNTQFNHPKEITPEAKEACDRLVRAGVVLGNQAVLLRGVNDDPHVMKKLHQELLRIRVRPYYLFHAKPVTGTRHFVTRVQEGLAIMEALRGSTSGLAIPTYVLNVPGGYGKVPLLPNYLLECDEQEVVVRTWEGRLVRCPNG